MACVPAGTSECVHHPLADYGSDDEIEGDYILAPCHNIQPARRTSWLCTRPGCSSARAARPAQPGQTCPGSVMGETGKSQLNA
jgi:hypothetical protein